MEASGVPFRQACLGYDFVPAQARKHHNDEAVKQLEALAPYPGGVGGLTLARGHAQRKWLVFYGGLTYDRTDYKYNLNAWKFSPDHSQKDLEVFDAGTSLSLARLLPAMEKVDFDRVTTFKCPVFLFEAATTTKHRISRLQSGTPDNPMLH